MVGVRRLVTTVDIDDTYPRPAHEASVSALHEAELDDGSRVVLLDDRGWTWSMQVRAGDAIPPAERPDAWEHTAVADLEEDARTVVGPEEPDSEFTQEQVEAAHWAYVAAALARHGVQVAPEHLAALPHDVELTERVLARIGRPAAS